MAQTSLITRVTILHLFSEDLIVSQELGDEFRLINIYLAPTLCQTEGKLCLHFLLWEIRVNSLQVSAFTWIKWAVLDTH